MYLQHDFVLWLPKRHFANWHRGRQRHGRQWYNRRMRRKSAEPNLDLAKLDRWWSRVLFLHRDSFEERNLPLLGNFLLLTIRRHRLHPPHLAARFPRWKAHRDFAPKREKLVRCYKILKNTTLIKSISNARSAFLISYNSILYIYFIKYNSIESLTV